MIRFAKLLSTMVLAILALAYAEPKHEENAVGLGLFLNGDPDLVSGITNITIVKVAYRSGYTRKPEAVKVALAVKEISKRDEISKLVSQFNSKVAGTYDLTRSPHEWIVFISTEKNGDGSVVIRETSDPNVLMVILDPVSGTADFIKKFTALP
jgi:hypothetical protein